MNSNSYEYVYNLQPCREYKLLALKSISDLTRACGRSDYVCVL